MNKSARILLIIVAIACFAGALSYPIRYLLERRSNESDLDELRAIRSQALQSSAQAPASGDGREQDEREQPGAPEAGEAPGLHDLIESDSPARTDAGREGQQRPGRDADAAPSAGNEAARGQASDDVGLAPASEPEAGERASIESVNAQDNGRCPGESDVSANEAEAALPAAAQAPGGGQEAETAPSPGGASSASEGGESPAGTDWETFDASAYREPVPLDEARVLPQYRELHELNGDMVGWLYQEDMGIDYPVMFTPEDEEYYLHRDFYGRGNANGQLILDRDCDPYTPSWNQIIYGHNMRSGSMFGRLTDYEDVEFWRGHKLIGFDSLMEERVYVVVACFHSAQYAEGEAGFRYAVSFYNGAEYDDWIRRVMDERSYDTGIDCRFGDEFITLSTCAYHRKNGRFVVVARRVRTGESFDEPQG